ncbi:MAG TPA: hypothetical protein GX709_01240 [Clostridiales bacterium]|nr:hypothetical protein [Clostridiales bacterium]
MVNFKEKDLFIDKINEALSDEEITFKLGEVVLYNVRDPKLHVTFIFNEETFAKITPKIKNEVLKIAENLFSEKIKIEINYIRVEYSKEKLIRKMQEFFKDKVKISHRLIDYSNISIIEEENNVTITLELDSLTYNYVNFAHLDESINSFLNMYFYEDIAIKFVKNPKLDINKNYVKDVNVLPTYTSLQNIDVEIMDKITHYGIRQMPYAIRDNLSQIDEKILVCGVVSSLEFIERTEKPFYKFLLNDTTGTVSCMFFPKKTKIIEDFNSKIYNGVEIIVDGYLKTDNRNGSGLLFVNNINLCKINYDTIPNQTFIKKIADNYNIISPQPYFDERSQQLTFLEEEQRKFKELEGEVVVFDLETTGTDVNTAKIVEIGAVKLVDGKFDSTFSTLVNPLIQIPAGASKVNNIYDEDVKDAPTFKEVLPDLYKFMFNAKLVAHNIDYDINVLNNNAIDFLYRFDNDLVCTLELSRSLSKLKVSNHRLSTLTKYFNIDLKNAHRALDDTIATAYLYLELLKVQYDK